MVTLPISHTASSADDGDDYDDDSDDGCWLLAAIRLSYASSIGFIVMQV